MGRAQVVQPGQQLAAQGQGRQMVAGRAHPIIGRQGVVDRPAASAARLIPLPGQGQATPGQLDPAVTIMVCGHATFDVEVFDIEGQSARMS